MLTKKNSKWYGANHEMRSGMCARRLGLCESPRPLFRMWLFSPPPDIWSLLTAPWPARLLAALAFFMRMRGTFLDKLIVGLFSVT